MRRIGLRYEHDSIDVIESQIPGKGALDDREDRGVGSYTQRQGRDGYQRESGIPGEHAESVAEILPEAFQNGEGPHFATDLFDCGRISKAALRLEWVGGFFGFHLEMKAKFIFQVAIELTAAPKRVEFLGESGHIRLSPSRGRSLRR